MSSSKRESREDDVVEMKKALATGNVKQDSPASNSSGYSYVFSTDFEK